MSPEIIPVRTEPSMADLRAMRDASETPKEAKIETPEPVKTVPEPEAVKEPAETKQEPKEDEPLPEGVQKRIAKEAEKAARIQSEIDRAVSTRKAKEKELADLTASGSAPAQKAAAEKSAPKFLEPGHETESWNDFHQRELEYERAEMRKVIQAEFEQRQHQAAGKAKRDEGVKAQIEAGTIKDAAEFTALMDTAEGIAPAGLQFAISALDNWSGVAVHLAKDPAKLKELAAQFDANPYAAVAKLGRIEASLKTAPKAAAVALPEPPAKEGGGASASTGVFDIEKASISQLRRQAEKLGIRKAG